MPVAMISTSTSPAFGPFEVELDDLQRLLGFERDGGAGLHESAPLWISRRLATIEAVRPMRQCERGERWPTDWLEGRHALITGGGTGIGAAAARRTSTRRARRSRCSAGGSSRSQDVAGDRRRHGHPVRRHRPRPRSTRAFDEARAANGPIDMLIVNAGIAESAPFHKMTRDSWDRIIATNLTARVRLRAGGACRTCSRARTARLVFVASVASLRGVPYAAHYAASKHGLLGLMRSARGRICQDQPDRERGLPRLCRHADDRPVGRARVADHRAQRGARRARAITNMNASGRLVDPDGDRRP